MANYFSGRHLPIEQRLWGRSHFDANGCRIWDGTVGPFGYGRLKYKGKREATHRVAWMLTNGPIPAGLCVCHRCDVRACINPDHLWTGPQTENIADMKAKGRARSARGVLNKRTKLTEAQVLEIWYAPKGMVEKTAVACGTTRSNASNIRNGASWGHLTRGLLKIGRRRSPVTQDAARDQNPEVADSRSDPSDC